MQKLLSIKILLILIVLFVDHQVISQHPIFCSTEILDAVANSRIY